MAIEAPNVWLTPEGAAARAKVSKKTIYAEVKKKRLRAAVIGGRRELRIRPEWVDSWLDASASPIEVSE